MKFCVSQIVNAMVEYQDLVGKFDSSELAAFLSKEFEVPVSDEGLFEATFVRFCNEYCG